MAMNKNKYKRELSTALSVALIVATIFVTYYLFVMRPNSKKLAWVSEMYQQCMDTSERLEPKTFYWDLQNILEGARSFDKDRFLLYSDKIKHYRDNGCKNEEAVVCEDAFLYAARSFLLRGNEEDYKEAFNLLDKYKNWQGVNIYYDAVLLDVSFGYASRQQVPNVYLTKLLGEMKVHVGLDNYFNKPHGKSLCKNHLKGIIASNVKSGEYLLGYYIQEHIGKF